MSLDLNKPTTARSAFSLGLILCSTLAISACASDTRSETFELRDGETVLGCVYTDLTVLDGERGPLTIVDVLAVDVLGQPISDLVVEGAFPTSPGATFELAMDANGATLTHDGDHGSFAIDGVRFSAHDSRALHVVSVPASASASSCAGDVRYGTGSSYVVDESGTGEAHEDGTGSSYMVEESGTGEADTSGTGEANEDGTGSSY